MNSIDYDKVFSDAHHNGAERHSNLWLQANEFVLVKARRLEFDASTKKGRALLSVITLSVLDSAKRYYEGPETDAQFKRRITQIKLRKESTGK